MTSSYVYCLAGKELYILSWLSWGPNKTDWGTVPQFYTIWLYEELKKILLIFLTFFTVRIETEFRFMALNYSKHYGKIFFKITYRRFQKSLKKLTNLLRGAKPLAAELKVGQREVVSLLHCQVDCIWPVVRGGCGMQTLSHTHTINHISHTTRCIIVRDMYSHTHTNITHPPV